MSGAADARGDQRQRAREAVGAENGSDHAGGAASRGGPDERGGAATDAPLCDLCGGPMRQTHCKLVCDQCGYMRDCSDP